MKGTDARRIFIAVPHSQRGLLAIGYAAFDALETARHSTKVCTAGAGPQAN
ncbi:MAG: hypothetical protein HYX53_17845 [Chloroflexi bacterium]|nr:hypothetical protein [Chloroflexota bacterium]